jgi:hypothetical protein
MDKQRVTSACMASAATLHVAQSTLQEPHPSPARQLTPQTTHTYISFTPPCWPSSSQQVQRHLRAYLNAGLVRFSDWLLQDFHGSGLVYEACRCA